MKTAICVTVLLLAMAAIAFQLRFQQPPLKKYKTLPDFELTERSGQPLRLADLKGKVWLADFIYTTCPGPCPVLSSRFSALQTELEKHPDLRLVSISINPEHDTPAVLREYAKHFGASDRWLFLTGPKETVRNLVTGEFMQAVVDQADAAQPFIHSTRLALVDRHGIIRAFYDGAETNDDEPIRRDIARLLRE